MFNNFPFDFGVILSDMVKKFNHETHRGYSKVA